MAHVHLGIASAIIVFLEVVAIGIIWRTIAFRFSDTMFGKVMLYGY